jgi:hypothetical protein
MWLRAVAVKIVFYQRAAQTEVRAAWLNQACNDSADGVSSALASDENALPSANGCNSCCKPV